MRRWVWLATYLTLAAIAAYASWPFVGLYQLGRAVHSADADTALQRIDLSAVRRSLINQALNEEVDSGRLKLTMDEHAEQLVREAAMAALDARAAEFLTPDVLRRLITEGVFSLPVTEASESDGKAGAEGQRSSGFSVPRNPLRYLRDWRLSSPVTFKVELGDPRFPEDRLGLTLRRHGLTWLLTEVRLSKGLLQKASPLIEERMHAA